MKKIYNNLIQIQLIRYFIVGGFATIVDWGSFYLLAIRLQSNYQGALIIAFILGSITNYLLNKFFTFQCKSKKIAGQLSVHLSVSFVSLLMNMGFMYILVSLLSFGKMPSRIIVTLVLLVVNFFMHKNLTFNKRFFQ